MIRRAWRVDMVIAVVVALIVLIVSPGLAISGILALIVLLVCSATLAIERRREHRTRGRRRRGPRKPSRRVRAGSRRPRPEA